MQLKVGVIIGRFQVPQLHEAHLRLYREVLERNDQLVVLLGISPTDGFTAENPLTFNQRQTIMQNAMSSLHAAVLPLPNQRTDEEWSNHIDALLKTTYPGEDITLYGGRDSFVESYKGTLKVERINFHPPLPIAGTSNRAAIKEGNSPDFYAGQIYALQRQFPHAYPTVDVAVVRSSGTDHYHHYFDETLLIQRTDSGHWCFPGGFVDPTDESLERAASREIHEELGLSFASGADSFDYVGSFCIDDFRYRGTRDKIITSFFKVPFFAGPIAPNYDEVQDFKWVRLNDIQSVVSVAHQPLALRLRCLYHLQRQPNCTLKHDGPCNVACGEY